MCVASALVALQVILRELRRATSSGETNQPEEGPENPEEWEANQEKKARGERPEKARPTTGREGNPKGRRHSAALAELWQEGNAEAFVSKRETEKTPEQTEKKGEEKGGETEREEEPKGTNKENIKLPKWL